MNRVGRPTESGRRRGVLRSKGPGGPDRWAVREHFSAKPVRGAGMEHAEDWPVVRDGRSTFCRRHRAAATESCIAAEDSARPEPHRSGMSGCCTNNGLEARRASSRRRRCPSPNSPTSPRGRTVPVHHNTTPRAPPERPPFPAPKDRVRAKASRPSKRVATSYVSECASTEPFGYRPTHQNERYSYRRVAKLVK